MKNFYVNMFGLGFLGLITLMGCEGASLEGFRFHPTKDHSCFQIYNSTEPINSSTCKKPQKQYRRICTKGFSDEQNFCGIYTPSGEVIIVPCTSTNFPPLADSPNFDISYTLDNLKIECHRVYKEGRGNDKLCPTLIDKSSIGLKTPDGYTIMIESDDCRPGKLISEIAADRDFVANFTFDPEERSCYKIYTPDQDIAPYTCLNETLPYHACVRTWEENRACLVLTTQKDETVVINCVGASQSNCLQVYTDGDEAKEVCMEELEEGCVGITTPSGLRMLFACRSCRISTNYAIPYDKQKMRRQRQFVKKYFQAGQHSYYKHKLELKVTEHYKKTVYPYWLPNTNCYGLTLNSNETIILQCTDREFEPPGCFKIKKKNEEEESDICAQVLQEECVVIITPKGKTVVLGCYNDLDYIYKNFVDSAIIKYQTGNYYFPISNGLREMYKHDDDCSQHRIKFDIEWLYKYDCWGVVTPDLETIILECPSDKNQKKIGCFKIYTQNYELDNQIIPSSYEEDEACMEILSEKCVGITTPKGWNVNLDCFFSPTGAGGVVSPKPREPIDKF